LVVEFLSPVVVLSLVIACAYAFALHFLWGRKVREIPVYLAVSIIGFFLGTALAGSFHSTWPTLGSVSIIEGTLGAWLLLFIAYRLAT
jgi:uncharacterized membrane protein YeaQ/YmgE (transglycosylase-associated protein family)